MCGCIAPLLILCFQAAAPSVARRRARFARGVCQSFLLGEASWERRRCGTPMSTMSQLESCCDHTKTMPGLHWPASLHRHWPPFWQKQQEKPGRKSFASHLEIAQTTKNAALIPWSSCFLSLETGPASRLSASCPGSEWRAISEVWGRLQGPETWVGRWKLSLATAECCSSMTL